MRADPSATSLLEHRQWVRTLARSLVVDANDADDLEQRTWLAALRRPPAGGWSRAWLGTVVRNLAGKERRREARAVRRERLAARPEALAAADDLVAEAEAHRRVVEAVLDLEEPYRSTILLRYFRDLGPTEIARRDGIPLETVRARLRRALEQLRRRFEREEGRAAWGTVLLPLLGGAEGAGRSLAITAATGATVMSKKVVVFFAVWALLATALYTNEIRRAPPPASRIAFAEQEHARRSEGTLAAEAAAPGGPSAREELEAFHRRWLGSRASDLRGRLVDAGTGGPLRVVAAIAIEGELPDGTPLRFEVASSPDGEFSVAGIRYPLRYRVTCNSEDEGIEATDEIYVNEDCADVVIEVRVRTLVQGHVLDRDGRPVPRAEAHVSFREKLELRHAAVAADAEGRFRVFVDAPAEAGLNLAAAATGHFPSLGRLSRVGKRSYRGEVRLTPGPRIMGVLLDHTGKPVVDAEVRLVSRRASKGDDAEPDQGLWLTLGLHPLWVFWPSEDRSLVAVGPSFRTDTEGRFEGWGADPGMELWGLVDVEDRPVWYRRLSLEDAHGTLDLGTIRLPAPGPGLSVVLQTEDRAPLAGATVEFSDADLPDGILVRRAAITDARGVARSPALLPGKRYRARIQATDTTRESFEEFEARDGVVLTVPPR